MQNTHRCWPSRVGWGVAAFLAAYLIFMHSYWWSERQTWEDRAKASLQNEVFRHVEDLRNQLSLMSNFRQVEWENFIHDRKEDWWKLHPEFKK